MSNSGLILPEKPAEAIEPENAISCGKCAYFVLRNAMAPRLGGECRRIPPIPSVVGADKLGNPVSIAFFPGVMPNSWCGEFRASRPEMMKAS